MYVVLAGRGAGACVLPSPAQPAKRSSSHNCAQNLSITPTSTSSERCWESLHALIFSSQRILGCSITTQVCQAQKVCYRFCGDFARLVSCSLLAQRRGSTLSTCPDEKDGLLSQDLCCQVWYDMSGRRILHGRLIVSSAP